MAHKRILLLANGSGGEAALAGLLPFHPHTVEIVAVYPWSMHPKGQTEPGMAAFNAPFIAMAEQHNLTILSNTKCNSVEMVDWLIQNQIDSILIMAWGVILKAPVLDLPLSIVNMHPSLLPRHRGFNPFVAAIRAADTETGVTFHQVTDTGIDTGPIILQETVPIYPNDTGGELLSRCEAKASTMMPAVVSWLLNPEPGAPQSRESSYAPAPKDTDACIDWSLPPEQLCRYVRSLQPWFPPYSFWSADVPLTCQRVTARPFVNGNQCRPGQLVALTADTITIQSIDPATVIDLFHYQLCQDGNWLTPADSYRLALKQLPVAAY